VVVDGWVGGCLKVENKVLEGPKNDFGGFLTAVDQLHTNVEYLTMNRSFKASDAALNHARGLLAKGMTRLEEEFRVLLTQHRLILSP
jgi:exocyst complex protein 7